MTAMVSHYPRVSEWVYIGDTAINMAQVTGIEFGNAGSGAYAIVRLSSYNSEYEAGDLGNLKLEGVHHTSTPSPSRRPDVPCTYAVRHTTGFAEIGGLVV